MHALKRIHIAGYKSIRDQEVHLGSLNVLIGANGAGKSNFIGIFHLLREIVDQNLQVAVAQAGGANRLLHFGRKMTQEIRIELDFPPNGYSCRLVPTASDALVFAEEVAYFQGEGFPRPYRQNLGGGHRETELLGAVQRASHPTIENHVLRGFQSWRIYHFHDTSTAARVKQTGDLGDNRALRSDAGNLAAFLYFLGETHPEVFRNIVETVRMAAPFFRDLVLEPDRLNHSKIRLEWREQGSDEYFDAHALSDGTLRFLCLATLLLQPELPATLLIDEPELGLHPYAIQILAELLRSAATRTQVVVSTQSVTLVNQLSPEDILVVDRADGASVFHRLSSGEIADWLDGYSLGELWEKNVLGGRPSL